mmetsp:Transcript_13759/g.40713  ORF Transcript_13759/g.40713 Transcript_13759/m.40713 type:complete len:390 (+) Transcript_13759:164-1333(+)
MRTALRAAPRRSWSPQTKRSSPLSSKMRLRRTRPTSTSYSPVAVSGMGYLFWSTSSTSLTPGASASSFLASSTSTSLSNSSVIASEWARSVGMRTAVQLTGMSGSYGGLVLLPGQSSRSDPRRGEVLAYLEDLARLPRNLHLLLGVAILLELVDVRDDVERQGVSEDLVGRRGGASRHLVHAVGELRHAGGTGAGGSLIGAHDDALNAKGLVQRCERHERNGRGAVGVGKQLGLLAELAVDLRHHQRHVLVHAERRRVIDHNGTSIRADLVGILYAEVTTHGKEYDVAGARALQVELLEGDAAEAAAVLLLAGATRRAEEPQVVHRELALLEALHDLHAHGARGARDAHLDPAVRHHGHAPGQRRPPRHERMGHRGPEAEHRQCAHHAS